MAYKHDIAYEHRSCEICGKDMYVSKKSPQRFCGSVCQSKWQETRTRLNNPKFEGREISCDWCGKKYCESGYKLKVQKHFFCSTQCRQDWYASVWSQQPEWKEESRIRAAKILENRLVSQTQSKPQLILNQILDDMKIKYENEYNVKYYAVDNYLSELNLFIEVMGDYWHCNPVKYPNIKYQRQRENIRRDKAKHTYILEQYNIPILYLWETDLVKNQDLCKILIEEFIVKNGMLDNYNSFNYHLENNSLYLNNEIISAYNELSKDEISQKLCLVS